MKLAINKPSASKINYTALAGIVVGAMSALGVIPEDQSAPLLEAVTIAGGALIVIFRTFFTAPE